MEDRIDIIKKKVYYLKVYKWLALLMLLLIVICFSLKCCDTNTKGVTSKTNNASETIKDGEDGIGNKNPRLRKPVAEKVRLIPIDSTRIIEDDNDPVGRSVIKDIVNIYLKENVEIETYWNELSENFSEDSLLFNYYAEAYKRIQIIVNEKKKEEIKSKIKADTVNVKFVTNEWVMRNNKSNNFNDPDFDLDKNFWFYEKLGLFEVWKKTKGNKNIKIAVIDDGFDLNHVELKNQYVNPWNVFDYSDNVYAKKDIQIHGTHVAGTIVAEANNEFGISGVAPNCRFIPVQISNESGIITTTSVLDGIFYALDNGANIINLSLGLSVGGKAKFISEEEQNHISNLLFKDEEKLWSEVFEIAEKENVVIVQAAGNDNLKASIDPMKRSKNTLVIGATNQQNDKAKFSNYGAEVNLYVPGVEIYSTFPENDMGFLDGTSMSSPLVAGCVALYLDLYPNVTPNEIINEFTQYFYKNAKFNLYDILNKPNL